MASGNLYSMLQTTSMADAPIAMSTGWKRPPDLPLKTTTLLASVYQRHELIAAAAERFAKQYGVQFLYRDFRPNFRAGNQRARELGFYMQKYCGCVFSEQDRYQKQIDRDKLKFAPAISK